MDRNTRGGVLLMAGAAMSIAVMAFHPSGHGSAPSSAELRLNVFVHAFGIAVAPMLMLGLMAFVRSLGSTDLTTAALVSWATGGVAVINAAVASGCVQTGLLRRGGSEFDAPEALQRHSFTTHLWNQGYASVYVLAVSLALALLGLAMLRAGLQRTGAIGVAIGALGATLFLSGLVRLDVHGFGLILLTQSLWLGWLGVLLFRGTRVE